MKEYPIVGDDDPRTGFSFAIQELELCFWREAIKIDEVMKEPFFLEMSEEKKELEKRYFYFTTVSIGTLRYFNFMDNDLADT
ncbi:hypothetical protein JNUCC31_00615 [Paenibacillus sp. JNUCC31]|uniref:hypothetical protein n=1 Tax=Paenibacillus sp. JNUCC-31 TaxID=2777983 RepID=UPI00177B8C9C|nr:hypothetical protein [Paenibacillus sp. JNUCC-31]QOS79505.1 hypothetical protein JNUCC31_00615 [Paenibacillus sp. JNUCC-31]